MGNSCNSENDIKTIPLKIPPNTNKSITSKNNEKKHAPSIPQSYSDKLCDCVFRIEINNKISTGFFMKIKKATEMYFLITCYHCIDDKYFENKETITIYYGKKEKEKSKQISLDKNQRYIKRDKVKDIIIIEIIKTDNIPDYKYLYPDLNYLNGYDLYKNKNFFLAGYPRYKNKKKELYFSSGEIKEIDLNKYKFIHSLDAEEGSSGSPICLKDGLFVIGIHNGRMPNNDKIGTFIGIVIEELEIRGKIENIEEENTFEKNKSKGCLLISNPFRKNNFLDVLFNNNQYYILNEMTIIYDNKEFKKRIRIFGDIFFENNRNKILIKINDKIVKLKDPFLITEYKREIEITLFEINPIEDLSFLFHECIELVFLPNISEWNTSKVTNMSSMFFGCTSLKLLPDISKWDMTKVTKINQMFAECSSLKTLPDFSNWKLNNINDLSFLFYHCSSLTTLSGISEWITSNVTNMSGIFSGCSSLKNLPDISKWDTSRVTNFSGLFQSCCCLLSLPDISVWETRKLINIDSIFNRCFSLTVLPNISKWETSNVETMDSVFKGCISLKSIPNISLWETPNLKEMNYLFSECNSLTDLPDISNWDTSNITEMNCIFEGCTSLTNLPNISKWDTSNVKSMFGLFANCSSLTSFPDISNWKTSNVITMEAMFYNCKALKSLPDISKWNVDNLENISHMLALCLDLEIPNFSNWFKKPMNVKGIFQGRDFEKVPIEIINSCNKWLHPDAVNYQIYPELIRFLFS